MLRKYLQNSLWPQIKYAQILNIWQWNWILVFMIFGVCLTYQIGDTIKQQHLYGINYLPTYHWRVYHVLFAADQPFDLGTVCVLQLVRKRWERKINNEKYLLQTSARSLFPKSQLYDNLRDLFDIKRKVEKALEILTPASKIWGKKCEK